MKRVFTLFVFAMLVCWVWAQLPAGSTAPDFTATDLEGRKWNLYTILGSGRPVIMDVSATWCGPCWSYHNAHHLKNLYNTYGPCATGKLQVFFVEGDGATNTNCLYGSTGCVGGTQGNWVAGTPYPIFDNAAISSAYKVSYFPTVYLITPDKKVTEVGQKTTAQLWALAEPHVNQNIPLNYAALTNLKTNAYTEEFCTAQTATPSVKVNNLGGSKLSNVTLELRFNGKVIQTKDWSGDLCVMESDWVTFDKIDITEPGVLSVTTVSTNGQSNAPTSSVSHEFIPAPQIIKGSRMQIQVQTDASGKDTYWEIHDDQGNILAKGGNEKVGSNGGGQFPSGAPADPTAYANFKSYKTDFLVPENGCITVKMVDGVGNGFSGPGRFRLYNSEDLSNAVYISQQGWTDYDVHVFSKSPDFSSTNDVSAFTSMSIFPNPTSDLLNVNFNLKEKQDVQIFVTNAIGAVVLDNATKTFVQGENQNQFDVTRLPAGLYFINLRTDKGLKVEKFTKN